jgi:hypothetical protein
MKKKADEDELFKEINKLCLDCIRDCKQPKNMRIYKCLYQPKKEKNENL